MKRCYLALSKYENVISVPRHQILHVPTHMRKPTLHAAEGFAPADRSTWIMSTLPTDAAKCSGVFPS